MASTRSARQNVPSSSSPITQRLLDYIKPDVVHVLADGRIVETGGPERLQLEAHGYDWIQEPADAGNGSLK